MADSGVDQVAALSAQQAANGGSNPIGVGGGNSYFPDAAMTAAIQAADNQAKWAYYNKMLELQTVPMTQVAKDQAAAQAAAQAATTALGSANLNLQQLLGAQNAVQSAAGLQSQEAMGAMNLAAQLRGPQNAFQQQAVMEGLNQAGLSNAVGAIAGTYNQGTLGRQYAPAQAANLGTLASDMLGAGGQTGQLSPAQIAMNSALGLQGQQFVSNSVQPYLNTQSGIANQTANWAMGTNFGQPTGQPISATTINTLGTQWGVDPKYIQGYVNANGSLPQSPGTLTQWNVNNGFQSPIDGSYTKPAPVASVTGYNSASAATQTPVNAGSAINAAQTAMNGQYNAGMIPQAMNGTTPQGSQYGTMGAPQSVTKPVSGTPPAASGSGGLSFGSPTAGAMTSSYNSQYGQPSTSPPGTPAPGSSPYGTGAPSAYNNGSTTMQPSYSVGAPSAYNTGSSTYQPNYSMGAPSAYNSGSPTPGGSQPYTVGAPSYYTATGTPTAPGTYAPGGAINNAYMSSLPSLNNIDVRNYNRLNDDTKSFLGSAYQAAGYSQNDLNNSVTKGATPWAAPVAGTVG